MDEHDPVNHPAHYTHGGIECIDAIEAAMTADEFVGFLRGQMIKYVWRLGRKGDGVEDVEKALWYGRRLTDKLEDMQAEAEADNAFIAGLTEAGPAYRTTDADPETWLTLGDMVASAQRAEARDLEAMLAKRAELLKLSHLEDTEGRVVLMYTDHVNWDEAPEWANFLAIQEDFTHPQTTASLAYWFQYRPEWLPERRYWRSNGLGGKIMDAKAYGDGTPRLFVRATG